MLEKKSKPIQYSKAGKRQGNKTKFHEPTKTVSMRFPRSVIDKIPKGANMRDYFLKLIRLDSGNPNKYIDVLEEKHQEAILVVLDLFKRTIKLDGFVEMLTEDHQYAFTILEEMIAHYRIKDRQFSE